MVWRAVGGGEVSRLSLCCVSGLWASGFGSVGMIYMKALYGFASVAIGTFQGIAHCFADLRLDYGVTYKRAIAMLLSMLKRIVQHLLRAQCPTALVGGHAKSPPMRKALMHHHAFFALSKVTHNAIASCRHVFLQASYVSSLLPLLLPMPHAPHILPKCPCAATIFKMQHARVPA